MDIKANSHLCETAKILKEINQDVIHEIIGILREVKSNDSTIFLFGNGGSHSTASHFANDLLKVCGVRAICISNMNPTMLAYMNDISPDAMFSSILKILVRKNDALIAFSCSGESQNVINALAMAHDGVKRVIFTGNQIGKAIKLADIVLKVPSNNIFIQESIHLAVCHAIIESFNAEML